MDKPKQPGLDDVREQLDDVDRKIVEALAERDRLVGEVARRKMTSEGGRVRDAAREEALLSRLVSLGQDAGLDGFYVTRMFREVIDHSVRLQQEYLAKHHNPDRDQEGVEELVVAYQGVDGAYSQLAASRHFGPRGGEIRFRGYPTFKAMMEAVRDGAARYGMLPIENTTAGSINDAYDLLAQMDLSVVGEEVHKVDHCLVALEQVPVSRIRRVYSHPQALAQCSHFLSALDDCHVESFTDTAMAVQKVGQDQDLSQAAIASEEAARRYGLHVIKRGIANQKENFTRFMVVAAKSERVDERVACKTSLILATRHEQGALLQCLNGLAKHDLNLTKLESRPRPHTPWEYLFYIDFEGNLDTPQVADAVAQLRPFTSFLRVLGSYPARTTRAAKGADGNPAPAGRSKAADDQPAGDKAAGETPPAGNVPLPPTPDREALEQLPFRLASRRHRAEDTVVPVGALQVGGPQPVVMASVSSVPSREILLDAARAVRSAGAHILRLPCFDPLVRDRCDELGVDSLELLEEVGRLAGLPVAAEVLHPADVDRAADRADVLQVGGSNMMNSSLLRELGRVDRPVLLERGVMASLDEWLTAADYLLERGNAQVLLCERGIRTFERATPSTLDLSAVAVLRDRSHLPVLVDPGQACGNARWVSPLAVGARHAGAQGVVLEVVLGEEPAPAHALSVEAFGALVTRLGEV